MYVVPCEQKNKSSLDGAAIRLHFSPKVGISLTQVFHPDTLKLQKSAGSDADIWGQVDRLISKFLWLANRFISMKNVAFIGYCCCCACLWQLAGCLIIEFCKVGRALWNREPSTQGYSAGLRWKYRLFSRGIGAACNRLWHSSVGLLSSPSNFWRTLVIIYVGIFSVMNTYHWKYPTSNLSSMSNLFPRWVLSVICVYDHFF